MNERDEHTPTDHPPRPSRRTRGRRTRSRSRRKAERIRVPRRLLGGVALVITVLLVTIWFAGPPLISGVARGFASSAADAAIEGGVEIDRLSLSWLGAQRVEGLTVTDPAGETVATIGSVTVDRGLLSLAFSPLDLGRVTLGGGEVDLVIDETGESNLARALAPTAARRPDADDPEGEPSGPAEPVDPPAIPAGLSLELVSASPVLVRYRTPGESGEMRVDLSSDRITPGAGGELRLEALESDDRALRVTASFAGFRDDRGRLDVEAASPRIEITGERLPRAFEAIAAATAGVDPAGANGSDAAFVSVDAAFAVRDGSLVLADASRPARVAVPLSSGFGAAAIGAISGGPAVRVETGGQAVLEVSTLDAPVARVIATLAGWREPEGAPGIGAARLDAELVVPAVRGAVAAPGGDLTQPFSTEAGAFRVSAGPLREGLSVNGDLALELGSTGRATLEADLTARGLDSAPSRLVSLDDLAVEGTLRAENLPTALADRFVPAGTLPPAAELAGGTASLVFEARVDAPGSPAAIDLRFEADAGQLFVAEATLDEGTLRSRGSAARLSIENASGTADALLAAFGVWTPDSAAIAADETGTGSVTLEVPSFTVPIAAAQPLTEAAARFQIRMNSLRVRGGGRLDLAIDGSLDRNRLAANAALERPAGPDAEPIAARVRNIAGVLLAAGLPATIETPDGPLAIGPGGDATLRIGTIETDLGADDPLARASGRVALALDTFTLASPEGKLASLAGPLATLSLEGDGQFTATVSTRSTATAADAAPSIDVTARTRTDAILGPDATLASAFPSVDGAITLPRWLAESFAGEANADLAAAVLGETIAIDFISARSGAGPIVRTTVTSGAVSAETGINASPGDSTLRVADTLVSIDLTAEGAERLIAALAGGESPPASLPSGAQLRVTASDATIPVTGFAPDAGAIGPISVNVAAAESIAILVTPEDATPRTIALASLDADIELFGEGLMPAGARFDLLEGEGVGARLASVDLSTELGRPAPVFVAEITELDTPALDRVLGAQADREGPLQTTLGPTGAITIASGLGLGAGPAPAQNAAGDAVLLRVESPKLTAGARVLALRDDQDNLAGFELDEPLDARFTLAPELLAAATRPAPGAPGLALERAAPISLTVDTLRLGPPADLLAPGVFAIDASLGARDLTLRRTEPLSGDAPVTIATLDASLRRVAQTGGASSPLAIDLRTTAPSGDESFRLEGTVRDLGPDATLDATARGAIASMLVDTVAGAGGLLESALGNRVGVDITLDGVAIDRSRGRVAALLEADNGEASVVGTLRDGMLLIDPAQQDAPSSLTLSRVTRRASEQLIGPLFPLLGIIEKTPDDDPLVITLGGAAPLTLPTDNDLTSLNGPVTFDLGTLSFRASDLLGPVLEATKNNRDTMIGSRLGAVTVTLEEGVATYNNLEIPIGEFTVTTGARIDLVNRTRELRVGIPFAALAREAASSLPDLPGLRSVPFILSGPIDGGRQRLTVDSERLVEEGVREGVREGVDRLLDDLLNR